MSFGERKGQIKVASFQDVVMDGILNLADHYGITKEKALSETLKAIKNHSKKRTKPLRKPGKSR